MQNDSVYRERNCLVAFLARMFPSGLKKTDIEGWDPVWHNCVYVDTPHGQLSWHFHDNDADLFNGLPDYTGEWDGHSTEEKYCRLSGLTKSMGHWCDCAVYNEPALPAGPCNCGGLRSGLNHAMSCGE